MKRCLLLVSILFCSCCAAQRLSVATDALGYADFGTLNAEVSVAVGRHFTIAAGAAYNPWQWGSRESGTVQNKQRTLNLGVRWWPWSAYSGWWFSTRGQVREYSANPFSRGGLTQEGDALGAGISLGYALMLSHHFNLDFGAGLWAGSEYSTRYSCPSCGDIISQGRSAFLRADNIHASIAYIF